MLRAAISGVFLLSISAIPAFALCTSYPNALTNGTTADGGQVMANFNCAVLQSGATINGATLTGATTLPGSGQISSAGLLGIGMTPSNPIDITKSQNADSRVVVLNATNGTGASARLDLQSPDTVHSLTLARYPSANTGTLFGLSLANTSVLIDNSTSSNGLLMGTTTSTPLIVGINNVEASRWGTNGSFLLGTTTNGGWGGNAKVAVQVSSAIALSAYASAGVGAAIQARVDATSIALLDLRYATSQVGSITTNGTSTAYNTTSDARLKALAPVQTDYRNAIGKLWVGDFMWKKSGLRDFGIVAQQAYPLFPSAIHKPSDEKGIWQADYGKLAPLALWGVKDLYRSFDKQNSRIAALEQEVSALRQINETDQAEMRQLKAEISAANDNQAQIGRLLVQIKDLQQRVGVRAASN